MEFFKINITKFCFISLLIFYGSMAFTTDHS
jgi:hypothetical protein